MTNLHAQLVSPARAINTITAKCSDVSISSLAINVNNELEKMREQVQNIVRRMIPSQLLATQYFFNFAFSSTFINDALGWF
ncbi:MAG: endoribonuclease YicC domain-containing protein [Nitrososphaerales archaeon]